MKNIFLIASTAALVSAGAAHAQPATAPSRDVVRAQAEGDRLLKAAGAEGVFSNETASQGSSAIALRHRASGYLCLFNPGKSANRVSVHPSEERGEAVSCFTETFMGRDSRFISRWDGPLREAVGAATTALLKAHEGRIDGDVDVSLSETLPFDASAPTYASVSFKTAQTYERAVFFPADGWVVEGRLTAPRAAENAAKGLMDRTVYSGFSKRTRADGAAQTVAPPTSAATPWRSPSPNRRQTPTRF